jgi:hypothetical protein
MASDRPPNVKLSGNLDTNQAARCNLHDWPIPCWACQVASKTGAAGAPLRRMPRASPSVAGLRARAILAEEMSHYQHIDAVARLMMRANVDEVIGALPEPFRSRFIEHGITHWIPRGERLVIGIPLPDEAIEAFREWFKRRT